LTFDDNVVGGPTWSFSGGDIAYYLRDQGRILRRAADGSGEAVPLVESERPLRYPDWSRDGRYLAYCQRNVDARGGLDIHYTEFGSDGKAGESVTFLDSPANEVQPELSPDGKFLAYASNELGSYEIYVRPFPGGGGKWQVSTSGGSLPRWRSDGKELYYLQGDTLMAVAVSTESALEVGRPQPLFDVSSVAPASGRNRVYDVAADGQRFLTVAPVAGADAMPSKIRVVENWYEEFRGREKN
jgi:Tol biopolymer transport system component